MGTGSGTGAKRIDPVTEVNLAEDASLEMDTVQIRGVDSTVRKTTGTLAARAKLVVRERKMCIRDSPGTERFPMGACPWGTIFQFVFFSEYLL